MNDTEHLMRSATNADRLRSALAEASSSPRPASATGAMRTTADDLMRIADGYARAFPDGDTPLRILVRLTEELGEVASEVAHLEDHGAKSAKHGAADPARLAAEIEDLLHNTFALIRHYDLGDLVDAEVAATAARHAKRGLTD